MSVIGYYTPKKNALSKNKICKSAYFAATDVDLHWILYLALSPFYFKFIILLYYLCSLKVKGWLWIFIKTKRQLSLYNITIWFIITHSLFWMVRWKKILCIMFHQFVKLFMWCQAVTYLMLYTGWTAAENRRTCCFYWQDAETPTLEKTILMDYKSI